MSGSRTGLDSLGRIKELVARAEMVESAKQELLKDEELRRRAHSGKNYSLTTKDVARMFGVHPKTVDRWRRRLGLPSKKFGRSVKFRDGDVRRWAAQRKEG